MSDRAVKLIRDGAALVGLALVFAGCWWIYPPAALILAGGLILAGAVWGHHAAEPAAGQESGPTRQPGD